MSSETKILVFNLLLILFSHYIDAKWYNKFSQFSSQVFQERLIIHVTPLKIYLEMWVLDAVDAGDGFGFVLLFRTEKAFRLE